MKRFQRTSGPRALPFPRVLTAVTGTVALSLAASALGAAPHHRPEFPISIADAKEQAQARFKELDSDGNGEISPSELAAAPMPAWRDGHRRPPKGMGHEPPPSEAVDADLFERLDADGNGQLSKSEFTVEKLREARHEAMQAHVFARLDKDGNGSISRDELPSMSRRLEAMDSNHDGTVTREEARAFHKARRSGSSDTQG